jgi:hypothetical protein
MASPHSPQLLPAASAPVLLAVLLEALLRLSRTTLLPTLDRPRFPDLPLLPTTSRMP